MKDLSVYFLKPVEIFFFFLLYIFTVLLKCPKSALSNAGQAPTTEHGISESQKREPVGNNAMILGLNPPHPKAPVPLGALYFSSIRLQVFSLSQYFSVRHAQADFKQVEPCPQGETGTNGSSSLLVTELLLSYPSLGSSGRRQCL